MNLRLSNWKKDAPFRWNIFVSATTGLFSGMIPIISSIRSMGENLKHDLGMVYFPAAILLLTTIDVFAGKSNHISVNPMDDDEDSDKPK